MDGEIPRPNIDSITDPLDKFVATLPFAQTRAEEFMNKVDDSKIVDVVDIEQLKG